MSSSTIKPPVHFLHIPKTGGTSLASHLRTAYGPDEALPAYGINDLVGMSEAEIKNYRCFTGHFNTALMDILGDDVVHVTILREPAEQVLSLLFDIKRNLTRQVSEGEIPGRFLTKLLPVLNSDTETFLDSEYALKIFSNMQTRILGNRIHFSRLKDGFDFNEYERVMLYEGHDNIEETFENAKKFIDNAVVCLTEDLDKGFDYLAYVLNCPAPEITPYHNINPDRQTSVSEGYRNQLNISDSTIKKIEEITFYDRKLYEYAREKFNRQIESEDYRKFKRSAGKGNSLEIFKSVTRISEWWEFKLVPIFAFLYIFLFMTEGDAFQFIKESIVLLLLLISAGSYANVLNNITDLKADAENGKNNYLIKLNKRQRTLLVVISVVICIFCSLYFLQRTNSFIYYWLIILTWTLYSVPPFRLKVRSLFGAIADAFGSHVFPTLFAVSFMFGNNDSKVLVFVLLCSFFTGMRGIFWHQLDDRNNDLNSGVRTFAVDTSVQTVVNIGEYLLLPLELISLVLVLYLSQSWLAWFFFVFYLSYTYMRNKDDNTKITILTPGHNSHLILFDFYMVFMPMAYLFELSIKSPVAILLVFIHYCLFRQTISRVARDMFHDFKYKLWPVITKG